MPVISGTTAHSAHRAHNVHTARVNDAVAVSQADPVPLLRPDQFRDFIKDGSVVVEFMNFGCPYCKHAAPHLEKVAREKMGNVKFAKMSLRDPLAQVLASQYGATLLPSFAVFKDGSFVGTFSRQGRDQVEADFIRANVDYAFGV